MAFITSINLTVGVNEVTPVHVTVADQNGNPLPPSTIDWKFGASGPVVAQADSTGFNFVINGNLVQSQTYVLHATYNGPGNPNPVVGPDLTFNITVPVVAPSVTALQYMSP